MSIETTLANYEGEEAEAGWKRHKQGFARTV